MTARVLVVDDEPMVRALIVRALTDEGYERLGQLPTDIPTI
jgi:DNA-binding response OmpR family regulator